MTGELAARGCCRRGGRRPRGAGELRLNMSRSLAWRGGICQTWQRGTEPAVPGSVGTTCPRLEVRPAARSGLAAPTSGPSPGSRCQPCRTSGWSWQATPQGDKCLLLLQAESVRPLGHRTDHRKVHTNHRWLTPTAVKEIVDTLIVPGTFFVRSIGGFRAIGGICEAEADQRRRAPLIGYTDVGARRKSGYVSGDCQVRRIIVVHDRPCNSVRTRCRSDDQGDNGDHDRVRPSNCRAPAKLVQVHLLVPSTGISAGLCT